MIQPIRILSYNVRYFGHATRGLASTKKAMKRIAGAIAALKPLPAIVCLQEVETRSLRSTVAHPTAAKETQLEQFLRMLSVSLAEAGKPDAFGAYYFPAHAYRLSAKTQVYTTGLAILALHGRAVRLAPGVDLDPIAGMTAGFVGADLANIINEAALLAVRRDRAEIGLAELQEAVERVVAGLEKRQRVLSAKEKERVAHHEAGHALVALALPGTDTVQKISIIPRGIAALGYTLQLPVQDRFLLTQGELEDRIAVLLGGRVGEELVFGDVSTGAQDDLVKATEIARAMVRSYGMSSRIGHLSFDRPGSPGQDRLAVLEHDDYSEQTAREIDAEVRRVVEAQHGRVRKLLAAREPALRATAAALVAKETLSGDELRALVEDTSRADRPLPAAS